MTNPKVERSGDKNLYESLREMIIWLGLIELAWIAVWLFRSDEAPRSYQATVVVWIVAMLAWAAFVVVAGKRGLFLEQSRWLSNLIGFSLVLGLAGAMFGATDLMREGVVSSAANTSHFQLVLIHTLRLAAIGAFIKYLQGELPLHFVLIGAVPDFLFAVSAVVVAIMTSNGTPAPSFLSAWHWTGFALFTGAGVSMFFSVPSPLRITHSTPDASIVFRFPMVLAPNLTVPLFMLAHAVALVKLYS